MLFKPERRVRASSSEREKTALNLGNYTVDTRGQKLYPPARPPASLRGRFPSAFSCSSDDNDRPRAEELDREGCGKLGQFSGRQLRGMCTHYRLQRTHERHGGRGPAAGRLQELIKQATSGTAGPWGCALVYTHLQNNLFVEGRLRPRCLILMNSTKHCSCLMTNSYRHLANFV